MASLYFIDMIFHKVDMFFSILVYVILVEKPKNTANTNWYDIKNSEILKRNTAVKRFFYMTHFKFKPTQKFLFACLYSFYNWSYIYLTITITLTVLYSNKCLIVPKCCAFTEWGSKKNTNITPLFNNAPEIVKMVLF